MLFHISLKSFFFLEATSFARNSDRCITRNKRALLLSVFTLWKFWLIFLYSKETLFYSFGAAMANKTNYFPSYKQPCGIQTVETLVTYRVLKSNRTRVFFYWKQFSVWDNAIILTLRSFYLELWIFLTHFREPLYGDIFLANDKWIIYILFRFLKKIVERTVFVELPF